MKTYRILLLACSLFMCSQWMALPAFAVENIKDFFTPAVGTVIMPVAGKYIIDLDATDKVAQGDLLSVIYEGEKIIHPTSGEILGTLHDYGPVLQITEIKSGYSYAQVVSGEDSVKRGDQVSRFENIPVYFLDETGQNAALYTRLKSELSQLNWTGYLTETGKDFFHKQPLLVIKQLNNNLVIADQSNSVIQVFATTELSARGTVAALDMKTPGPAAPVLAPQPSARQLPAITPQDGSLFAPPPQYQQGQKAGKLVGLIRGSRFNNEIFAIKFADFSGTGVSQAVVALDDRLVLGSFKGSDFIVKSHVKLRSSQKIFKLSALDIDADGASEIFASGVNDLEIDSMILKVKNGQLFIHSRHDWLFNVLEDATGDPLLVGQKQQDLIAYPPSAYRLQLVGVKIKATPFKLSPLTQLYGSTKINSQEGRQLNVMFTQNDKLKVMRSDKSMAWQSEAYYGGLEAAVLYMPQNAYQDNDPRKFHLKGRLISTARNSVMLTKHEGSRFIPDSSSFGAGRIVELYWNGFSLEESGSTPNLGGYIPDFDLVDIDDDGDQDLVAAVVYTKKGLFTKPVSGIVVIANDR